MKTKAATGGVMASGLGATDIGDARTIGGLSAEVFARLGKRCGQARGFHFEPHVATEVFDELLGEVQVRLLRERTLQEVLRDGTRVTAFMDTTGDVHEGKVFIDATYEGDLMAAAKVRSTRGSGNRR